MTLKVKKLAIISTSVSVSFIKRGVALAGTIDSELILQYILSSVKKSTIFEIVLLLISNQMIDLLFFAQPPILKCVTERPHTKVPVSATPWNASVRVKLTHGMQFHSQGPNSYASLAVRGQERCALALGIWVCSLCLFLVKSLAFNNLKEGLSQFLKKD